MKTTVLHIAICWICSLSLPSVAVSGEIFDFMVDDDHGGQFAFARLELAKLPATLDDFVSLSFSESAQQKFGFDFEIYPGTFDDLQPSENGPRFISDGFGGLTGTDGNAVNGVTMRDFLNIPATSLPNVIKLSRFNLTASSILQRRDQLALWYINPSGDR